MEVDFSIIKAGTQFGDLIQGEVFWFPKETMAPLMRCEDGNSAGINAVNLVTGELLSIDKTLKVQRCPGKFVCT